MKKNSLIQFVVLASTALLLQSCGSTKAQRAVEEKVAATPTITNQKALEMKQEDTIASAQGLSEQQRQQLNALRADTQTKADTLDEQSMKLREILVKNLVAADYGSKKANEIRVIKSKLVKINRERLDLTLNSIEKAQVILGREARNNEVMMNSFLERDFDGRGSR